MINQIHLGQCPNCKEVLALQPTEEESIFYCPACMKKCKQYVNGKILYNVIDFNFDEGDEYP